MKLRLTAILLLAITAALRAGAGNAIVADSPGCRADTVAAILPDTVAVATDTVSAPPVPRSSTYWIRQLFENGFHINAPDVEYPRFPRFLLKVYNWGDHAFNHYDPEYVVGTGHNWKVLGKSYNWFENYGLIFSRHKRVNMISDLYADIGGYLCFMAVSVGYMFNANEIIGNNVSSRNNFNFNFTCSRFYFDYLSTSTRGGVRVTRFGSAQGLRSLKLEASSNKARSYTGMYFFNHTRYSHAAAYCYSKYQLRSAGSWIAGFYIVQQNISLDFSALPDDVAGSIPESLPVYRFHYNDYCATGGYGYNWAIRPRRWLFNITAVAGAGYKHTHQDNTDGTRSLVATNLTSMMGLVYNHRALFAALQARVNLSFYFNSNYTFFNQLTSFQFVVGARF